MKRFKFKDKLDVKVVLNYKIVEKLITKLFRGMRM